MLAKPAWIPSPKRRALPKNYAVRIEVHFLVTPRAQKRWAAASRYNRAA